MELQIFGNKSNKSKFHALGNELHIKFRESPLPVYPESVVFPLAI